MAFADISSCGVCVSMPVSLVSSYPSVDEQGSDGEGFLNVESMVDGEGLERFRDMGWMGDIEEVPLIGGESDEEEEDEDGG